MMLDEKRMTELFGEGSIELSSEQFQRLDRYAQLLCEWNEKINLTAITDSEGIEQKHFYDSIVPFYMTELPQGASIIDVGTGAGFPSCPLKVMRDDVKLTLLDSLNKRINFLRLLSDEIGLSAECTHGRAEEQGRTPAMREKFDVATARAVANLSELCEYCLPFVKVGGMFIALKGSGGEEELQGAKNAIKVLGGRVEKSVSYNLPCGDGRTLIVIRKISQTPTKYPRNRGQMTKKPL